MTRPRRSIPALAAAQERAERLQAIDENLDFGGGVSLAIYQDKIAAIQAKLTQYNALLSEIDKFDLELDKAEVELKGYSSKLLTSVRGRYGRTSWEYGQAGGKNSTTRPKPEAPESNTPELPQLEMPEANGKDKAKSLN